MHLDEKMRHMYAQMDAPEETVQRLYQQLAQEGKPGTIRINPTHTKKSKKPILFRTVGVVCACACLAMGLFYLFPFYTRDLSANNVSSGSMQEVKLEPSAVEDHLSMPSAMTLSGISWHCTKRWAAAELPELGDYLDTGIIEPYNGASSAVSAEVYQIAQSTDSLQALESNSLPYAVAAHPQGEDTWYCFVQDSTRFRTLDASPLAQESDQLEVGTVFLADGDTIQTYSMDLSACLEILLHTDSNRRNLYHALDPNGEENAFQPSVLSVGWEFAAELQLSAFGISGNIWLDVDTGLLLETLSSPEGNLYQLSLSTAQIFWEQLTQQAADLKAQPAEAMPSVSASSMQLQVEPIYQQIQQAPDAIRQLSGYLTFHFLQCNEENSGVTLTASADGPFQYDANNQTAYMHYDSESSQQIQFGNNVDIKLADGTSTTVRDADLQTESYSDFQTAASNALLGASGTYLNAFDYDDALYTLLPIGTASFSTRPCYILVLVPHTETETSTAIRLLVEQDTGTILKYEFCDSISSDDPTQYIESIFLTDLKRDVQADPVEDIPESTLAGASGAIVDDREMQEETK